MINIIMVFTCLTLVYRITYTSYELNISHRRYVFQRSTYSTIVIKKTLQDKTPQLVVTKWNYLLLFVYRPVIMCRLLNVDQAKMHHGYSLIQWLTEWVRLLFIDAFWDFYYKVVDRINFKLDIPVVLF